MNKILKTIGHILFTIFVMPFIFFIAIFIPLLIPPKEVKEDPYKPKWEMPFIELKEDYDG